MRKLARRHAHINRTFKCSGAPNVDTGHCAACDDATDNTEAVLLEYRQLLLVFIRGIGTSADSKSYSITGKVRAEQMDVIAYVLRRLAHHIEQGEV